jgi:hypothetical protein
MIKYPLLLLLSIPLFAQSKAFIDFKQAANRYAKYTDFHCVQNVSPTADEKSGYKRELRYLFSNYGKFSVAKLLSRLRAAHQTMVKENMSQEDEVYQRYEQISSALLLICAQVFLNETRSKILYALYEIDQLLGYWRYQYAHQIHYFFNKSPIKWIVGKKQKKEIADNIIILERKQRELYTLLGSLSEHAHVFTATGMAYEDCYDWIEKLFKIVFCIKTNPHYSTDGSRFDFIAAELQLKIKQLREFKNTCMASVDRTGKSNHFVCNWIKYTAALAAIGYMIRFQQHNPEIVQSAGKAIKDEASKFLVLLVHPLKKIGERGRQACSLENKTDSKKMVPSNNGTEPGADGKKSLEELAQALHQEAQLINSNISDELAKSCTTFREDVTDWLGDVVKTMQDPEDGFVWSSKYTVDAESINRDIQTIRKKIEGMKNDSVISNGDMVTEYNEALDRLYEKMDTLSDQLNNNATGLGIKVQLKIIKRYLMVVDLLLDKLQRYTVIIDKNILRLFELAALVVEKFVIDGGSLLKFAEQQLKDHELTLMFTTLIPFGFVGFITHKSYQWAKKHNYSPIRMALADVNSVLIEAAQDFTNYEYGKLMYLIYKLRDKATQLKDSVASEFFVDVAKLESKQYSAQTKKAIVENMFNKYAFLGKVVQ